MPPKYAETSEEIIVYLTDNDTDIVKAGLILVKRAASTGKRVNIDVSGLQLLPSAILGMLVILRKRARDINVDLRLVNVGPNILEQFAIIRRTLGIDDDDGPDMLGAAVPRPKPPNTDGGRAERHED